VIARLSYAIYLYHPIVMGFMGNIPVRHGQRLLAVPLILAVAAASYYLVERPFMRMRGIMKRRGHSLSMGIS
jgi:peptidoglycan/LPS O-acetylase OafA/YrhL